MQTSKHQIRGLCEVLSVNFIPGLYKSELTHPHYQSVIRETTAHTFISASSTPHNSHELQTSAAKLSLNTVIKNISWNNGTSLHFDLVYLI